MNNIKQDRPVSRILYVISGGGIGDLVISQVIPEAYSRCYENAKVYAWVKPHYRSLIESSPCIHSFLDVPFDIGPLETAKELSKYSFDLAVMPWSTSSLAWKCFLARIPYRVGQAGRLTYSFLFTHPVPVRSVYGDTKSHWVSCQLDYVRATGCETDDFAPTIYLDEATMEAAGSLLVSHGISPEDKVIIYSAGKGMPLSPASWPLDKLADSATLLSGPGRKIILVGSTEESEIADSFISKTRADIIDLTGTTDLKVLAAIIKHGDVVVCPDSGPAHIAAAVGTPVVDIFALKSDYPDRWRPYGVPYRIVRPDSIICDKKCVKEKCTYFECLLELDANEISQHVTELLDMTTDNKEV